MSQEEPKSINLPLEVSSYLVRKLARPGSTVLSLWCSSEDMIASLAFNHPWVGVCLSEAEVRPRSYQSRHHVSLQLVMPMVVGMHMRLDLEQINMPMVVGVHKSLGQLSEFVQAMSDSGTPPARESSLLKTVCALQRASVQARTHNSPILYFSPEEKQAQEEARLAAKAKANKRAELKRIATARPRPSSSDANPQKKAKAT